jgi:hypothetical protein
MNADDFLKMEYPQSIDLIKFYDTRQSELVKFASGLSAAVPTAILAFRAATPNDAAAAWKFTAVVAIVTGLSLLSIFAALVQNRLYFMYPARQANAIRAKAYEAGGPLASQLTNHMYVSVDFDVFQPLSSQTLQLTFVALQVGSFFGIASYAFLGPDTASALACAIWVGIGTTVLTVVPAGLYLRAKNGKTADQAVHGRMRAARVSARSAITSPRRPRSD